MRLFLGMMYSVINVALGARASGRPAALVESIAGSSADDEWTGAQDGKVTAHLSVRSAIAGNTPAMKSLLIGVLAILLDLVLKGGEFFA